MWVTPPLNGLVIMTYESSSLLKKDMSPLESALWETVKCRELGTKPPLKVRNIMKVTRSSKHSSWGLQCDV